MKEGSSKSVSALPSVVCLEIVSALPIRYLHVFSDSTGYVEHNDYSVCCAMLLINHKN